eukprot:12310.XXX_649690_649890_1 [CDS] Oithona nana genome sequencing.
MAAGGIKSTSEGGTESKWITGPLVVLVNAPVGIRSLGSDEMTDPQHCGVFVSFWGIFKVKALFSLS